MLHSIEGSNNVELSNIRTSEANEIWLAVHPCSQDLSSKQAEQPEKKHFFPKIKELVRNYNFSHTLDSMGVIDMGRKLAVIPN